MVVVWWCGGVVVWWCGGVVGDQDHSRHFMMLYAAAARPRAATAPGTGFLVLTKRLPMATTRTTEAPAKRREEK